MRRSSLVVCLVAVPLVVLALAGCKKQSAARPTPAAGSEAPAGDGLAGTVEETLDAAGYTYIKLATSQGSKWAAVPQAALKRGDRVAVVGAMPMRNFESKTLKRKFAEIYFGNLGGAGGASGAGGAGGAGGTGGGKVKVPEGHPPIAGGGQPGAPASQPHAKVGGQALALAAPVTKAPGKEGRTVAELHAQLAALEGKPIAVRGKVTKFNANIMGRNWVHLQDGTGSAEAANFDLTVTTKATATVGDIVLVRGSLKGNKDFGSGYSYKVLVEDATLEK